jgi:Zn-dependent M28 family amino/carboxypeptidase
MSRTRVAMLATAALMLVPASGAQAKPRHHGHHGHHGGSAKLEKAVSVRNIVKHQRALQSIADMNGGTRHTETPGFTASVAYVRERMQRAGLKVKVDQFNFPEWQETAPPVLQQLTPTAKTYKAGTAADDNSPAVDYITFANSPTAAVPSAPVVPVNDIVIPSPAADTSTAGCEPEDFPAATTGAVSLLQRGTCPFVQKLANAQAAGAVGAILMNEGDSPGRVNAGFRAGPPDLAIPAVFSSFAVGQELYQAFKGGKAPTVRLETNGKSIDRSFPQVVAETRTGDPRHMVIAGAHLDSVPAGPGINDDGSGTAWQLALAEQISKRKFALRNKVRFLWFGGEEDGLIGSQDYAARLPQTDVDRTDVMIDTDMIASPNYARLIYDGDGSEPGGTPGPDGSGTIENVFARYFARRGMATERIPFDGRSDYVGFVNRGIPSGGIFAGAEAPKTPEQVALYGGVAGEQLDPCYHEACDNIDTVTGQPPADTMNVYEANPTPENLAIAQEQANQLNGNALKSLREMSGAVTHALWYFGQNRRDIGSRTTAALKRAKQRAAKLPFRGPERVKTR